MTKPEWSFPGPLSGSCGLPSVHFVVGTTDFGSCHSPFTLRTIILPQRLHLMAVDMAAQIVLVDSREMGAMPAEVVSARKEPHRPVHFVESRHEGFNRVREHRPLRPDRSTRDRSTRDRMNATTIWV